jgi:hypothetical protein
VRLVRSYILVIIFLLPLSGIIIAKLHCILVVRGTDGKPLNDVKIEICANKPVRFCKHTFTGTHGDGKACIEIPDSLIEKGERFKATATKSGYKEGHKEIKPKLENTTEIELDVPADTNSNNTPQSEKANTIEDAHVILSQCFRAIDSYERGLDGVLITVSIKDTVYHETTNTHGEVYFDIPSNFAGNMLGYEASYREAVVQRDSFVFEEPTKVVVIKIETNNSCKIKVATYDESLNPLNNIELLFWLENNNYCERENSDNGNIINIEIPLLTNHNLECDYLWYESTNEKYEYKLDVCSISSIRGILRIILEEKLSK